MVVHLLALGGEHYSRFYYNLSGPMRQGAFITYIYIKRESENMNYSDNNLLATQHCYASGLYAIPITKQILFATLECIRSPNIRPKQKKRYWNSSNYSTIDFPACQLTNCYSLMYTTCM